MTKRNGIRAVVKPALKPAALAGAATLAMAQGALAEDFADAAVQTRSSSATEVQGIDVTAARRRESANDRLTAPLLDTPKSVTIIGRETIRQSGSLSLQDALRMVPGITFTSGEGGTPSGDRPNIRGFDSTSDVFLDGVRDAGGQSREVFAVEQVEVIKGPGSTYTGRGSTGGSINIVTKSAREQTFTEGALTLGTDNTRRVTVDVNRPIGDGAAFRINALYHENEVAGRDAVHGDRWGVAPSLALGLNGRTRAFLDYYHLETDELPDFGLPYSRTTIGGVVYGGLTPGPEDAFYGLESRDFRKTSADIGTVRIEHDLTDNLTLVNTTRYGRTTNDYVWTNPDDSRGNVANGYVFRSSKNRNTETKTLINVTQLRADFTTGSVAHTLVAGFEIGEEETHNQGYVLSSPGLGQAVGFPPVAAPTRADQAPTALNPGCSSPTRLGAAFGYNCTTLADPNPGDPWIGVIARSPAFSDTTIQTKAAYLFDTLELGEQWLLNVGLRYDDYVNKLDGQTATATAAAPYYTLTPTRLKSEDGFLNYQLGLVYKPQANLSLYAQTGTSSNPSGEGGDVTTLAATTVNLDPEENTTYELGAKWDALGGMLRLTAAAFHTEKTNARVTDANGFISTIGETRVRGVEVEASGRITSKWSITGGYAWLDAEIVDGGFMNIGTTAAPNLVPSNTNGKVVPNTPEHSISVWTSYQFTPAFNLGGGVQYQSERFANTTNTYTAPDFWRFDASAGWQVTERVALQLNVQNITDERYALRPFTTHGYQVAPGRSALLTALVSF